MKKMLYFILFTPVFCFAQEDEEQHEDIALFNKGIAVYDVINEDLNLDTRIVSADTITWQDKRFKFELEEMKEDLLKKSLQYFKELTLSYPHSELYYNAIFNKAGLYCSLDEYKEAKASYLQYVSSAPDTEKFYVDNIEQCFYNLAEIAIDEKDYKQASEYLSKIKLVRDISKDDTHRKISETRLSRLYGKMFIGLNDNSKALQYLLPTIFEYKLQGTGYVVQIAGTEENVRLAASLIKKLYTPEKARALFEKASKKIYYDKEGYYYIKFLNEKIEVYSGIEYSKVDGTQKGAVAKNIEDSLFKKLLNE